MRHSFLLALCLMALLAVPGTAAADATSCSDKFPGVDWVTQSVNAPVSVATAGMTEAMAARFGADVERSANRIHGEIGGLDEAVVCLATPELASAFSDLVAPGQRLHVGVFGEEKVLVMSAVEIRNVNDAIAFGLPHISLWALGQDLGIQDGYPDPLGSTIAHWYLARDLDRLERYKAELRVPIYLDDPNPEERTVEDANLWVGDSRADPYFFDPQFIGSQMGVFIDYAVATEGIDVLRQTDQVTWALLERDWRISIRDQFPRGNFGLWIGVSVFVGFILLAILLAEIRRRQKRREATPRPTPPADETLFGSKQDSQTV